MRTTLSIDDDLASLLDQEVKRSGASFKETVNHLIRMGLMAAKQPVSRTPFVVVPDDLGVPLGIRYSKVAEMLDELEGPEHR